MKKTVVAYGELLWDILPNDTVLGGAPFNFVYRINSLGNIGIMISRLGRDDFGLKAHEQVLKLGIGTDLLQWDHTCPTGTVSVSFDDDHSPDYVIVTDVAYDFIESTDRGNTIAAGADCICFGTLIQRSETSRRSLEQLLDHTGSCLKFLDINFRKKCYTKETVLYSLMKADILKLNEDEVFELARIMEMKIDTIPDFCDTIAEICSLSFVLVTLAEYGAYGCSGNGGKVYVPGYDIDLIDSLGSGDAFSAGFIHTLLCGAPLKDACMFGNVLGALVATQKGATSPVMADDMENLKTMDSDTKIRREFEKYII